MKHSPASYDLKEICSEAGVTPRTVHFYIQQGLLPPAGFLGPGAKYNRSHLYRLRLIRLLQKEHLPLAEIRRRLEALSDFQIEELVTEHHKRDRPSKSSAVDYIRGVLTGANSLVPKAIFQNSSKHHHIAKVVLEDPASQNALAYVPDRSQWERVTLTPDLELHFRRPLSRDQNRKIEALIQYARGTFKEEQ
jgi:DNA-binding transcriptional MerR regulator